jgi:PAS domain S-box-containing protein
MLTLEDYQWLFRKAPSMATSISEDGVYLDINDAFLARLGYEREEMVGHRPEEFVTEESARRISEELRPALRRTGKLKNKPLSFVAKNGDVIDCLSDAILEYKRDGKFLRTIAIHSEASDLARANFKYRSL